MEVTGNTTYKKRIASLRGDLKRNGRNGAVKVALAEALFRSAVDPPAEPIEALRLLNEAINLAPFRPSFFYHRGLVWQRIGNPQRALTDFEHAHQFDPGNVRVLHQMALAHLDHMQTEEDAVKKALGYWKQAEQVINKKKQAFKTDNEQEAKKFSERMEQSLFVFQCGRIEATLRQGKFNEAFEQLKNTKAPAGCASLAGEMALKFLVMTGQGGDVESWLGENVEERDREQILKRLKRYLSIYKQAEKVESPGIKEISHHKGRDMEILRSMVAFDWASRRLEQEDGGLTALKNLIESYPEDETLIHAYLALLQGQAAEHYEAEEWDDASMLWKRALQLDPYNPGIALNLALVATRSKQYKDYESWWDRVQRLWYTRLFIVPENKKYRKLITEKHLAFAAKAREMVKQEENKTRTFELLRLWVDESERYFLARQFGFKSAYKVLGVATKADESVVDEAYTAMKSKINWYSNLILTSLEGDALKEARLKMLEGHYRAVSTEKGRKAYKDVLDEEETREFKKVHERKVSYLIAASELLQKLGKELSPDWVEEYAYLTERILAHPFQSMQRQFEDAGKADSETSSAEWVCNQLAQYYVEHLYSLSESLQSVRDDTYEMAEKLLNFLRPLHPNDVGLLWKWVNIEKMMGNPEHAIGLAETALEQLPEVSRERKIISDTIKDIKENEEAVALRLYLNPAIQCMNEENWNEAIPLLEEALEKRKTPMLHYYLVQCYMQKEDYKNARLHIGKGQKLAVGNSDLIKKFASLSETVEDAEITPFYNRALEAENKKQWEEAIANLDEGIEVNANHALLYGRRAHCELALVLKKLKDGDLPHSKSILSNIRKSLEKARKCPNAEKFKELTDSVTKQVDDVEEQLPGLKESMKDNEIIQLYNRAMEAIQAGEWEEASDLLNEADTINANHALIHTCRAQCGFAMVVEKINAGELPPSKSSLAIVHQSLKEARKSPNAGNFKELIQSVARQVNNAEKQLQD